MTSKEYLSNNKNLLYFEFVFFHFQLHLLTVLFKFNVINWRYHHWLWQDTFVRAKSWVKELQRQASPNIVIALAGNKSDLADKRLVETEVYMLFYAFTNVTPVWLEAFLMFSGL